MASNIEEYNYFVDQSEVWHDYSRLDENITHVVRKGIFMQDDNSDVEEIVITLCGLYHYGEPSMEEFDADWYNAWVETGACEECFSVINKREFNKWLASGHIAEMVKATTEEETNE
jgi:hypothetical protein